MKFISTWSVGFSVYLGLLLLTEATIFTERWWLLAVASVLAQTGWGCGITYLAERQRDKP